MFVIHKWSYIRRFLNINCLDLNFDYKNVKNETREGRNVWLVNVEMSSYLRICLVCTLLRPETKILIHRVYVGVRYSTAEWINVEVKLYSSGHKCVHVSRDRNVGNSGQTGCVFTVPAGASVPSFPSQSQPDQLCPVFGITPPQSPVLPQHWAWAATGSVKTPWRPRHKMKCHLSLTAYLGKYGS